MDKHNTSLSIEHDFEDDLEDDIDIIKYNNIYEDDYERISSYELSQNFFFNKENKDIKEEIFSKVNKIKQEEITYQTNEYNQKQKTFHKLNKLNLLLYQKFLYILIANLNKLIKRKLNQLINGAKVKNIIKKGYSISTQNHSTKLFINNMIKQEERKEKFKLISQKTFEKAKAIKDDEKKYLDKAKVNKDKLIIDKYKNDKIKNQLLIEKQKKLKEDIDKLKLKADGVYCFFLMRRYFIYIKNIKTYCNTLKTCLNSRYIMYLKSTLLKTLLYSSNKKIEKEKIKQKATEITIDTFRSKVLKRRYYNKIKLFLIKLHSKRELLLSKVIYMQITKRKEFIFYYIEQFRKSIQSFYHNKLTYFNRLKRIKSFLLLKAKIKSIKESKQEQVEKNKLIERLNSIALGYLSNN